MVPFVLPSVFAISEGCTKEEFTQYILSYLKPVLRMQEPVQVIFVINYWLLFEICEVLKFCMS